MSETILFNDSWRFLKTDLQTTPEKAMELSADFVPVNIPHDWLIYDTCNLYENSCGWYLKSFSIVVDKDYGERVFIRFDGVYMDSTVYINGCKIGDWKYGYTTFDMDITPALISGENEILVQVRHQSPNSRWYSGAGIYRNVWIRVCPKVYLPFDGTYVHTEPCDEGFRIEVETEIAGELTEAVRCRYSLCDENEQPYMKWQTLDIIYSEAANESNSTVQCSKNKIVVHSTAIVERPKVWDIDSPNCYKLCIKLYAKVSRELIDEQRITVGFRTMEFKPDSGFSLNGRNVKVHGVCEHHDFGCLGAAFSLPAMVRKLCLLRKMGVNAIRTSHNIPAPELMELADEMGFLIVNEAFDMWERKKTEYDYARFFKEWAERDVASWIRRDRNHPSIMLWSIGNEICDTHVDEHGQEIARRLIDWVKQHDPKENARVTIGSNYMPWENARKCADIVKIAGYNYGEKYYEEHHKQYPDWIIYGSETCSVVHSRGIYHFPLSQPTLADEDEQCSALGNSTTSWGAKSIEKCITDDRDATYAFGQFLWTGFDYIGEPTPYHTKNSYFGQLDTAGFPKDSYYIFRSEWTDAYNNPMVHLFPYWDFNEGQMIDVRACTNGVAVELFVNGRSFGRQYIDHEKDKKLLGEWQVPYTKGSIKAIAYDKSGNAIAEDTRNSFGNGIQITLEADKTVLCADGEDLCFLTIGVTDADGYTVENAMDYVTASVSGEGRLLGMDNGDSTDCDSYKINRRKLFNGKLLAVVGSTTEPGEIKLTVMGTGLKSACITLQSQQSVIRPGISNIMEVMKATDNKNNIIPVRKISLSAINGSILNPEQTELLVEACVIPENASDKELIWKVVNDSGIEIDFAKVEEVKTEYGVCTAKITAFGDGKFRVRCMSKSSTQKVKIISQLEFCAQGLGEAFLNPYEFISAGLYTETIGEIGNGNEKGISTSRDSNSGVVYSKIDFGDYGSDKITIFVFALSNDDYPIEIWQGKPGEPESELLSTVIYQKPSRWNVYQEETWKLPHRIKGVTTLAFMLRSKVHIKGFSFRKYEKSVSKLMAAECSRIYGDSFTIEAEAVTGIGNNVTLEYENMDFGAEAVTRVTICGRTSLSVNTIHIRFTNEYGDTVNRILEFKGNSADSQTEYIEQQFEFVKLYGKGKIAFVFLPGSSFDFQYFQFHK